jgi:hypothetical protein
MHASGKTLLRIHQTSFTTTRITTLTRLPSRRALENNGNRHEILSLFARDIRGQMDLTIAISTGERQGYFTGGATK